MGLHDRPYWRESDRRGVGGGGFMGGVRIGLPKPTPVVLGLIIACAVLFFLTLASGRETSPLYLALSLDTAKAIEIWRFITFQFMHGGPGHLLWNLVVLYFFGPPLERAWGPRKFLVFYLVCGLAGGLCFMLLTLIWPLGQLPRLVGASAGILGCLMACAILFPQMICLIFPIRWVAVFLIALYVLNILWGWPRALSDAAHLGGMAAAGVWIWGLPRFQGAAGEARDRAGRGAWERKLKRHATQEAEVDRILDKIRQHGITSLTRKEKKALQDATRRQREEERDLHRL